MESNGEKERYLPKAVAQFPQAIDHLGSVSTSWRIIPTQNLPRFGVGANNENGIASVSGLFVELHAANL